jgi:Protein of unknown function (DUF3025)
MIESPIWLDFFKAEFSDLAKADCWVSMANQLLPYRATRGEQVVSGGGRPLQFRQSLQDETIGYERGIFDTGQVPCRTVAGGFSVAQERHDFYNALVWLKFPKSKARLNELSMHALNGGPQSRGRGPLRDAITVFDENALLLLCSDSQLTQQLSEKQWHDLLVIRREQWLDGLSMRPICFGHALLQKLETPYKAITGHCFVLTMSDDQIVESHRDFSLVDSKLCEQLTAEILITKPFLPLPVLGIPGWCADNEPPSFYADAMVFRKQKVILRTD